MNWWDIGNAFFEGIGSVMTWLNVRRVYIDKEVKGVQWQVTLFWTAWGVYNLFLYPHLDLWLSFYGGISIVLANAVWVGMVIRYTYFTTREDWLGRTELVRKYRGGGRRMSKGEQMANVRTHLARQQFEVDTRRRKLFGPIS